MGGALYRGFCEVMSADRILVYDHTPEKLHALGIANIPSSLDAVIDQADVVLLAMKPQAFPDFCSELRVSLDTKLIVSIMAGISLPTLHQRTKSRRIIRAMPNLAVAARAGITAWVATGEISSQEKQMIAGLFQSVGVELECVDEEMIDYITPLSGSGPAFFFYLTELIESQARSFGFSEDQAQLIAEQTLRGSSKALLHSDMSAGQMRQAVTSKAGVTEAALQHLHEHEWGEIFSDALNVALQRSKELGKS